MDELQFIVARIKEEPFNKCIRAVRNDDGYFLLHRNIDAMLYCEYLTLLTIILPVRLTLMINHHRSAYRS